MRDLARTYTEVAIEALVAALGATKLVGRDEVEVPDHGTRVNAAQALLDRGYGKPTSAEIVAKEDGQDSEVAEAMSDEALLQEAMNRMKSAS